MKMDQIRGYLVKYLIYLFGALLLVLFVSVANAKNLHFEKFYQQRWCTENGGETEKVLPDKTRCDCENKTHAVEVEFAQNWHSAIGQALWYAAQTEKRAGIVLIVEKDGDDNYWIKLNALVSMYGLPIDLWQTTPSGSGLD